MLDVDSINLGFSRKAAVYDAYGAGHPAIRWARGQVRAQVLALVSPGDPILELNAGTGEDAAFLAAHGLRVHATDLADGMLAEMRRKAAAPELEGRLTVQPLSVFDLAAAAGGPYALVFSNFGGLNCVPDLRPVAEQLPRVLAPGGHLVWVIMPPFCPWELAQALRGRFSVAFRRLNGAVLARVEGARFMAYYFTPQTVSRALGPSFRRVALQSLALCSPPSFMDGFPRRFPRLYRRLAALDERVGRWPALRGWGDFFIYTARYEP